MAAENSSSKHQEKECFVIAPIGEPETEIRRRSDQVLNHIINPVVCKYGYKTIRADHISSPGLITHQVVSAVINSDLVIADLSGPNANVFYELAIRHAANKPVIQLIAVGESIPFDVAAMRTIKFDYRDLDSVDLCKREIDAQIIEISQNTKQSLNSPIKMAISLEKLGEDKSTSGELNQYIIDRLDRLEIAVRNPDRLFFEQDRNEAVYRDYRRKLRNMFPNHSQLDIENAITNALHNYGFGSNVMNHATEYLNNVPAKREI